MILVVDFELSAQIDRKCSLEGRDKEQARMYLYKYMVYLIFASKHSLLWPEYEIVDQNFRRCAEDKDS